MKLYSYWRSTAAYRVRIALNLKGIDYDTVPVHLVAGGGQQHTAEYRAVNPQGLVPALELGDGTVLTQSMAIMEYLEDTVPVPAILSDDPAVRAKERAFAQSIVADIHPLDNLRVLQYLKQQEGWNAEQVQRWYHHWIHEGFAALEKQLSDRQTPFAFGAQPGVADICLVAQTYNAHRFDVDMSHYPAILELEKRCLSLPAFDQARPENQLDAQPQG